MRRRLYPLAASGIALIALGGCVQATRHSNTMVFGTNTTFGLKVGTTTGEVPEIVVGYDRQEAVIMPLVANSARQNSTAGQPLDPCDLTADIETSGSADFAIHPCSLVAFRDGAQDSYSVLASFGAKFDAATSAAPAANGGLAQYFATGMAAQILALTGGAAVVATGPAAVKAAETKDEGAIANLLTGSAEFARGKALGQAYTTFAPRLATAIEATPDADLMKRLTKFEERAGVPGRAAGLCQTKKPKDCSDVISGRRSYLRGYAANVAKFEQALTDWLKD